MVDKRSLELASTCKSNSIGDEWLNEAIDGKISGKELLLSTALFHVLKHLYTNYRDEDRDLLLLEFQNPKLSLQKEDEKEEKKEEKQKEQLQVSDSIFDIIFDFVASLSTPSSSFFSKPSSYPSSSSFESPFVPSGSNSLFEGLSQTPLNIDSFA